jgi:YVTN family beta-propeller protein
VLLTRGSESAQAAPGAGRLVQIDPATNEVDASVEIGVKPTGVAVADGSIWATTAHDTSIWRVDAGDLSARRIGAPGSPPGIAVQGGSVYVPAWQLFNSSVSRFDASTGARLDLIEGLTCVCAVAAGPSGLWIGEVDLDDWAGYAIDLATTGRLRVLGSAQIPAPIQDAEHARWGFADLAVDEHAVWLLGDTMDRRLWRIDPESRRVAATIDLPFPPRNIAAGEGAVWVTDQLGDAVARIDPATNRIVATIPVGAGARGVAVGEGSIWVASAIDGTVSRIDPAANAVVATIDVDQSPVELDVGEGYVWVATDGR